ncbi:DMT family transporter [Thiotrichales bacterium 19S9-12]|nr:DMT family transporter [Thiotrichales bacterium 19S9-11]MCF6811773.1 DMT family transporter [Thiotrichales bacterium 19S9-12]
MWFITALLSALFFGLAGFMFKVANSLKLPSRYVLLGSYLSGSLGFSIVVSYEHSWMFSWPVLAAAFFIGVGSVFGNLMVYKAYNHGPASLTAPLINLNLVIIIILSVTIFGESLSLFEVIGIMFILMGAVLISFNPREKMTIEKKIWLLYVFFAICFLFMREGGLKITFELGMNNHVVLVYAYLLAFIYFLITIFKPTLFKSVSSTVEMFSKKGLMIGIITGIFSSIGLTLLAVSINQGPASIVMPIFSLRSFVIVLLSILLYKERLNRRQSLALILILISVMLLNP